jgi:hypothetical protein
LQWLSASWHKVPWLVVIASAWQQWCSDFITRQQWLLRRRQPDRNNLSTGRQRNLASAFINYGKQLVGDKDPREKCQSHAFHSKNDSLSVTKAHGSLLPIHLTRWPKNSRSFQVRHWGDRVHQNNYKRALDHFLQMNKILQSLLLLITSSPLLCAVYRIFRKP